MYLYIIYLLILCDVNLYWSIDLDSEEEEAAKVNYGSERELTLPLNSCFNFSLSRERHYLSIRILELAIHTLRT